MKRGDTLYFSPSISAGIQKKNVPHDSCYLYTALIVKSPSFLGRKVFYKMQGTSCKFLEKRREDDCRAFFESNDRGENVDNMWKNSFLKGLCNKGFKPHPK